MKIAYNPKTAAALTTAPANNDITFDLGGLNIFVRGEKFKGTDTTYPVFKKHTSAGSGGYNGLVPVPSYTATNIRFLREDGTWSIPAATFIYTQLTNQDLDDYLNEGKWYYAVGGNSVTNKPSGVDAFELYVGRNAIDYRYQKLITSNGIIWFRYYDSTAWKTWVRWYTDQNTDQKVLQSATTTANFRPVILGYTNTNTPSGLSANVTQQVYTTTTIYAQPSTGSLWANKLYSGGKPVLTEHQSLANYVTLNTAQTITGVKTFSTGPILAINATITQNQNSTSNYTTFVKWLKGGTSQGTYNPSIGQHNTGGDGTGSICILPYPTNTSPWNGTVGLFISKGVLRLDGRAVAIAENYYTKTESDNRYVNVTGDTMTGPLIVKASITGTQLISNIANGTAPLKVTSKTVVTNLNSDLLDGYHETSFFRTRGSQTIAGSIPTTTELSSNNNLSGNWNVTFPGASGHLVQFNTGSGSTRYMQFYSHYSGSLYWRNSTDSTLSTKSWKTIVDSANYTGIVLKIGTATKGSATLPIYLNAGTPTACSTTLGVSITGNAATATKLQTARTINGTSFNGTANITTAYWGATRTITLSGAVTGSASVNGSQNVTITTTYQTGSIDGRYVGGKKTAGHGSRGTAYTADTYSSNFVNKAFVAYAERGSWAYANNGYITTDTGVNIPLAGTAIFQWGASDTNKTQLFITPHNNSGVSNPATNEMLFYTSNGSGYISAWTRVLTHRNYTTYTVTKTGSGASGTWGISITGNANTATKLNSRGRLTALSGTNAGETGLSMYEAYSNGYPSACGNLIHLGGSTAAGRGELLLGWAGSNGGYASVYYRNKRDTSTANWSSWVTLLDSSNYTSFTNANYVQSLGTSGNYLTWVKNGATNNIIIPYATNADTVDGQHASAFSYKSWWHWSGQSGQPTWIWGGNSENNYYVYNPSNFSVNYATYSGSLSNNTSTNANTLYRNPGFTAWSVWSTFSNTPTNSYTNGINLNSSNTNYGWQLAKPAFVDRPYYRGRQAGSFTSWKGIAFTSDIPTVTNYYWANVKVSSSSSTSTSPTFSTAYTSNWFRSNGQTGWCSQTYGGGIYMTDSSYVRVYGGKRFYAASGYLSPYGGGSWISMATRTNCIVADQNNSASSAHALFRVKNSSGHAIAFGGLGANIGFYGFYASRISSGANGTDWSTVWNAGTGVITHSKTIYTAGYYHSSVNSNNYVLLAGGSYKNLADFAKGNAGSSTQGVYVTSGTVKAMTYKLNATVNSGSSGKLAYYSGTNSIDDYTSTKGSSSTPIYLNAGVPTACSGVIVKYWGWYSINCYSSTTPSYSKKGGNFNFVTSISRRSEGKYTIGTVYPSGYTWNNTIYWGSGRLNKAMSSNSSNSLLYVTMLNGHQSGSTYYLYVNTADDSKTNDGSFDVFFLCF